MEGQGVEEGVIHSQGGQVWSCSQWQRYINMSCLKLCKYLAVGEYLNKMGIIVGCLFFSLSSFFVSLPFVNVYCNT